MDESKKSDQDMAERARELNQEQQLTSLRIHSDSRIKKVHQQLHNTFREYVFNDLPARLIYIPEMRIVTRGMLLSILAPVMKTITDEDVQAVLQKAENVTWYLEVEVRKFVKQRIKYAILSHRWLENAEEPSLHKFSSRATKTLAGYKKLVMFCKKAQEYGCSLAWADTCCIDKSSSSELDEAVRSMFRWYQNAHICIAYLAESTSLASFDDEVWFTRGWTLQELLAPVRIKFYGKGWLSISTSENDKNDPAVLGALTRVTTIPEYRLRNYAPGPQGAREKLMWASTRRTTRIEDTAYSLIGIFNVGMSIAYGEGSRAFYRLMVEIIQVCYEWDIFLFTGPPSLYHRAIAESPRSYRALPQSLAYKSHRRGDEWYSISKRGLQIKMLHFPVRAVPTLEDDTGMIHTISISSAGDPDVFDEMKTQLVTAASSTDLTIHRWAVGIVDFERTRRESEGYLEEGQVYFAFLSRTRVDYEEWEQVECTSTVYLHSKKDVRGELVTVWIPPR